MQYVVAIDGPSGSGKSSVAKEVANRLQLLYVDTGAMFRSIAYFILKEKISLDNDLGPILNSLDFKYIGEKNNFILINQEKLDSELRSQEVAKMASKISTIECIRTFLLKEQRKLVDKKVCVMEGRDIGTVVFPKAFCKFFVTARPEVRAERRTLQLKDQGKDAHYGTILKEINERDERDSSRTHAPLKKSEDAFLVDTSEMTFDEVVAKICQSVQLKLKAKNE